MRGRYSENPSVDTFLKGNVSLRVQGSYFNGPSQGNCSRKHDMDDSVTNTPLPKRKRHCYTK